MLLRLYFGNLFGIQKLQLKFWNLNFIDIFYKRFTSRISFYCLMVIYLLYIFTLKRLNEIINIQIELINLLSNHTDALFLNRHLFAIYTDNSLSNKMKDFFFSDFLFCFLKWFFLFFVLVGFIEFLFWDDLLEET